MADQLPPIWEARSHTIAKHQILKTYLNAWMPIMSRQSQRLGISNTRLLFVDGFAGPGSYAGGQDGSPILALKLVLSHSHQFNIPVRFLFIEENKTRYDLLCKEIEKYKTQLAKSPRVESHLEERGDCEIVLNDYLDNLAKAGEKLGPAIFFLDQSGFSDVSMNLVRRIMSQPLCEVFSYLNWDHMNRFLQDESKWPSITKTFGGEEWKDVFDIEQKRKAGFMLDRYKCAIKGRANSKYPWNFAMCDEDDKLLYWLFFCTNNLRGLEEMKRAMWQVDTSGGFRFSDKDDPSQLALFETWTDDLLARDLSAVLQEQTLTLHQIKEFVLTETPCYLFKGALKILEDAGLLRVVCGPAARKKGTFPDEDMSIEFLRAGPR